MFLCLFQQLILLCCSILLLVAMYLETGVRQQGQACCLAMGVLDGSQSAMPTMQAMHVIARDAGRPESSPFVC